MSVESSQPRRQDILAALASQQPRTWQPGGIGPLWALFTLTLRQFLRGRRVLVLLVLSLLPVGLALLVRSIDDGPHRHGPPLPEVEFVFLFNLMPHALLPLTALLYGSGLILDEQEDQTLTYLLVRPLPKWGLYLAKLAAALCMVGMLVAAFVIEIFLAVYVGSAEWGGVFPGKIAVTIVLMMLSTLTYVAVFGAMSLLVKRSLIIGIIYIGLVEGVLANINFVLRQLTIMYYFRVLALHWLDLDINMQRAWSISLSEAPSPLGCVLTLLLTAAAATVLAIYIFTRREFYVKTPESN